VGDNRKGTSNECENPLKKKIKANYNGGVKKPKVLGYFKAYPNSMGTKVY
jgi:hypothetical protein